MIDTFESGAGPEDRARYEEWFGVDSVHPPQTRTPSSSGPLLSITLFWKHINSADPELPRPTRERLVDAMRLGLVRRFSPWESYVRPILTHSESLLAEEPDATLRVHLAADLDFLIPDLTGAGWEVYLMKSTSIRYCPGGFWRFLALGETGRSVTIVDSDRVPNAHEDMRRTRQMAAMGLGLWRVPGYYNSEPKPSIRYRPILGGHFGARGGINIRQLLDAFMWHSERGTLPAVARFPSLGEIPIHYTKWPDYGFDEWFQLCALYPHLVENGTLTFIPREARSFILPIDLEYAQWANPASESLVF